MSGFILKLLIFSALVYLMDAISSVLYYASPYQPLVVGVALAIAAQIMEAWLLKKGTLWLSTLADFIAGAVVFYLVSALLPGTRVTIYAAFGTGLILAVIEYFLHLWLIRSGKTIKSERS